MADSERMKKGIGLTLIFFGILFFLKMGGVFPASADATFLNWRAYPFYAAVIFLVVKEFRTAAVLAVVGLLFHAHLLISLIGDLAGLVRYLWPLFLIGAGVLLLMKKK